MKLSKTLTLSTACAATAALGAIGYARMASSLAASLEPASADQAIPDPGQYNVLVIVLDDVGTDQLKMYGVDPGPQSTCADAQVLTTRTKRLDVLHNSGLMFTRAYVNPLCSPTRACLMTGRYGFRTGIGSVNSFTLPSTNMFLPELIRDHNPVDYARGAFGKWHMAAEVAAQDKHPAENGFETFKGPRANLSDFYTWLKVTATGGSSPVSAVASSELVTSGDAGPSEETYVSSVTRRDAAEWINAQTRPFLAYVNFNPPHVPFQVPPARLLSPKTQAKLASLGYEPGELAGPSRSDQILVYQAALEAVDTEIQELFVAIAPRMGHTMVVIIGDNGTPPDIVIDPTLSGKVKRSVYEMGAHVPLIINGPLTAFNSKKVNRGLVNAVDLYRTLANFTGMTNESIDSAIAATGLANDSLSFFPQVVSEDAPSSRTMAYAELFSNTNVPIPPAASWLRSNTDGSYRYVRNRLRGAITEELYDLAVDPCNRTDLTKPPHVLTPAEQAALASLRASMLALSP